jgi:transcriptional regulator with XRE-family HTH domain
MSADELGADAQPLLPEQRVGKAMREAREAAGISLRKLAKQLGYHSHTMLSSYERGAVMPTDEVVARYERVLGLSPKTLSAVLEAARMEQHGDPFAKRRPHLQFEPDAGQRADDGPEVPSAPPSKHWRPRRWVVIAGGVAMIALVVGLLVSQPSSTAAGSVSGVQDRADPTITGCVADAMTLDSVEVFDPPEHLVGDLQLRSSARCGTSWGRFHPVAALGKIPQLSLEIDVFRPADAGSAPFSVTYDGQDAYGNMLISAHECVYAQVTLTRLDLPNLPPVRTACMRSAT